MPRVLPAKKSFKDFSKIVNHLPLSRHYIIEADEKPKRGKEKGLWKKRIEANKGGKPLTYKDLIRRCLLEEAEGLRLSPATAEEMTKRVLKADARGSPQEGGP